MNKEKTITLTNVVRQDESISGLEYSELLEQSAQKRAEDICRTGDFSHSNWEESLTFNYSKAGENLAKNYKTEESMVSAWVESPKHHENLVGEYTHIGIGYKECGSNTYTVQHFARVVDTKPYSTYESPSDGFVWLLGASTLILFAVFVKIKFFK